MTRLLLIVALVLMAGCDQKSSDGQADKLKKVEGTAADPLFISCHKHEVTGGKVGGEPYCLVPLWKMEDWK